MCDWKITTTYSKPLVYLCGTITPDSKHLGWRKEAEESLAKVGIGVLSPVRGKDPSEWTKDGLEGRAATTYSNGGFVERDERDLNRCDAVLLYFTEAPDRQSIGTWAEMGLAMLRGGLDLPVVVVSTLPEVTGHPFVYRRAARVVPTLEEGLAYLKFVLS